MNKEELYELKIKILKEKNLKRIKDYFPKMSAYDYLYDCNKDRLDSFAINYLGRKITYKELFDKINFAAKAYKELGVNNGDIVSMCMLSTPEAIISFYALNKIGVLVHMINIANSKQDIEKLLISTNSKIFVTNDIFYDDKMKLAMDNANVKHVVVSSLTDSLPNVINGDKFKFKIIELLKGLTSAVKSDAKCKNWEQFLSSGKSSILAPVSTYIPNSIATIAYTSGSTGEAKAVAATNESINAMPVQMGMTDQTFEPNDTIFNTLPMWIYYSLVNNIHDPLCLGVCLDLDPLFDSKKIDKRLKQYKFNHWNTIPAYVDDMVKNKSVKRLDLSHLKSITTGGDFLSQELQKEASELTGIQVGQGYGASELLGSYGYTYEKNSTVGSVGKGLIGNSFKIVSLDDNSILGVNQIGELYLFSPTMMKEYYQNPNATAEALIEDENGIIWYKTGDLAHFNEKNELFIDGRIRRIVMAKDDNGLPTKIFPDKIKKIILTNTVVDKCEVITVDDEKHIKVPIAFIVLKENVKYSINLENEIKNICSNNLENYTMPAQFIFIPDIPVKSSMKNDIEALEKMYESQKIEREKNKVKIKK